MLQWVPWQDAAVGAVGCATTTVALARRSRRPWHAIATWTRELTVVLLLYGLWQLAGDLSVTNGRDAVRRGRNVWGLERAAHLPSEAVFQRLVLGDRDLIRWCNIYYAQVHVAALGLCLVWLFARHRDRYPAVRNVLALVTGASLLIELVPVAPPRLVPGLGVVDTGHLIGPSVYPVMVAPGLDQLSAMPSLHVAWAIVVAGSIVYALRSPWRWLAVVYPVLTWSIVVVTGNHYWADGIVATCLCGLALVAVRAAGRRRRAGPAAPEPFPMALDPPPASPLPVGTAARCQRHPLSASI